MPPTSGVDPTRWPLFEKSSLTRMVADAAASRALTKKILSKDSMDMSFFSR